MKTIKKKGDSKCEVPVLPVEAPKAILRDRPIMIWDGDCGFCAKWIKRWEKLTGDKIQYAPYQSFELISSRAGEKVNPELLGSHRSELVLKDFPQVSVEDSKQAVQLVMSDGARYEAAEAVFRAFDYAGKHRAWLRFYKYFPGFKFISELFYKFIAGHRHELSRAEIAVKFFLLVFLFNLVWEVSHSPLYVSNIAINFWLCLLLAAVVDALIISLFFFLLRRVVYFIPIALMAAVVIEKVALRYGLWSYAPAMPIVPLVGIGLTPFVQLAVTGYIAHKLLTTNSLVQHKMSPK